MSVGFANGMTRTVAKRFYHAARALVGPQLFAEPGHFYSPIVDARGMGIVAFPDRAKEFAVPQGIDVDPDAMLKLWDASAAFRSQLAFSEHPAKGHRYHWRNDYFGYGDAVALAVMLHSFAPRRIIEIGGGYSTACMLDIAEQHLGGVPDVTVIEPYPQRLLDRLRPDDRERVCLIAEPVQTVPNETFDTLEAGDILFVDSSHVIKTGSDVGKIVFDVLPRLKPGVLVHFHDVFFPFEYLSRWVIDDNRSWNEAYLLRAFLMYNREFAIILFNDYFRRMPMRDRSRSVPPGGGSLWLRRTGDLQ